MGNEYHVRMLRCSLLALTAAAFVAGLVAGLPAAAQGAVFVPSDRSPAKNPCPDKGKVPDGDYAAFKEMLANVFAKESGVVEDIGAQVRGRVPDDDERAVDVEFYVVDEEEFKKEYSGDVDSLNPGKKQADLENGASQIYGSKTAYTYITEPDGDGRQKVKVKVFCKDSLRIGMIDGSILELVIHELVHAKLYVMRILMPEKDPGDRGAFPFPDHDGDAGNDGDDWDKGGDKGFYDEVKRLLKKAKQNPKLAFLPGQTLNGEFAGVVELYDVYGLLIGKVPVAGRGTIVLGAAGGSAGAPVIPIEIVAMELTGTTPYPVTIREDPARTSAGTIQPGGALAAFPAHSFFDLFFEYGVSLAKGKGGNRLGATVAGWPPFGAHFAWDGQIPGPPSPPDAEPPPQQPPQHLVAAALSPYGVVAGSLTLVDPDSDGDGVAGAEDADDDNDGIPDAEDPRPRALPFRAVAPGLARD